MGLATCTPILQHCRPHLWEITSTGTPFSSTCVDEDARSPLMMSHQITPKPIFLRTSRRNGQDTESKGFMISSLRRIWGCFCWWSNLAICWTSMKLSWMNLFFMKALRLLETIWSRWEASLFARIFVINLAKLCTRLIGPKSLTLLVSSLLGSKVI